MGTLSQIELRFSAACAAMTMLNPVQVLEIGALCGLTKRILTAYAVIAPLKVSNMILGGGIIRSGGKTGYVMGIDFIGTRLFGVPPGPGKSGCAVFNCASPYHKYQ